MPTEAFSDDVPSPRISFSYDLLQSDTVPRIPTTCSSSDFDFSVFRQTFDLEASSADELFSDGKILPIQINRRFTPMFRSPPHPTPPVIPRPQPKKTHHNNRNNPESAGRMKSPFWRFNRSSKGGGGGFCPLPLLSRSNSTGGKQKQDVLARTSSSSWQCRRSASEANNCSTSRPTPPPPPPLKRNNSHGLYSNNRSKFNPLLNVPPANFFGLASIFSGRKDRSKKKHY